MKLFYLRPLKLVRSILPGFSVCVMLHACTTTTYYYVVRHAEKRNVTDTSTLTLPGTKRAQALKDLLINKNIDFIFASVYVRTQLTAQPLADALNKPIELYSPDTTINFAKRLNHFSSSHNLIVGHSNNIAIIVKELSGADIAPIADNDFDNIYTIKVVKALRHTTRSLVPGTYGAPSP